MYKLYMDLLYINGVENAYKENTDGLMYYSGFNLGNYAFRHGLNKILNTEEYKRINWRGCRNFLQEQGNPSELLLSCANWVGNSEHEEAANKTRVELIEKMDCPVTPIAIGAQSHVSVSDFKLGPNTERLLYVFKERSSLISVRDQFTQEVFAKFGVNNTVVTGCPSNFINEDTNLGEKIINNAKGLIQDNISLADTRYHISEYSGGNFSSAMVLSKKLKILSKSNGFYIVQSPELLPFLLNETRNIPHSYTLSGFKGFMKDVKKVIRSKTLHFSTMEPWLDFSRTCDISLGMRIHGNMIPLQSGVPSIVIGHDSRTTGLSKTMGIPTITAKEFSQIKLSALNSTLLDKICHDMAGYDANRIELLSLFTDVFEKNNLSTDRIKNYLR